jgi:hypothetical protein
MILMRRSSVALLVLLATPPALGAQGAAPTFAVTATVDALTIRSDALRLGLSFQNSPSSTVPLWGIIVDVPARVTRIETPAVTPGIADADWFVQTDRHGASVAEWFVIADSEFAPGMRTPTLFFEATGLTDLVTFRAVYYAPPPVTENPDEEPVRDRMLERSVSGTTVGIVPPPPGATPASLAARARPLLDRSCGDLGWITHTGVCNSLTSKLESARKALEKGDTAAARSNLRDFLDELEAQHGSEPGKHVRTAAYALLRPNIEYILQQL